MVQHKRNVVSNQVGQGVSVEERASFRASCCMSLSLFDNLTRLLCACLYTMLARWVRQVKIEFGDKPEIYNEFLDIMKNFKVGAVHEHIGNGIW